MWVERSIVSKAQRLAASRARPREGSGGEGARTSRRDSSPRREARASLFIAIASLARRVESCARVFEERPNGGGQ